MKLDENSTVNINPYKKEVSSEPSTESKVTNETQHNAACPCITDASNVSLIRRWKKGIKSVKKNLSKRQASRAASQINKDILIKEKELELGQNPTLSQVNQIMDLYRQATEQYGATDDLKVRELLHRLRIFLNRPRTVQILVESVPEPELWGEDEDEELEVEELEPEDIAHGLENAMLEAELDLMKDLDIDDDDYDDDIYCIEKNNDHCVKKVNLQSGEPVTSDDETVMSDDETETSDDEFVMSNNEKITSDSGVDKISELEILLKNADEELANLISS